MSFVIKNKEIDTPERALMYAFLACHNDFNYQLSKKPLKGRAAQKNPNSPQSFRQCTFLGDASDLATPANPATAKDVYGHIDGYFLEYDKNLHKDEADKWGFEGSNKKETPLLFIPLTAPLTNRPLTAWVLSGKDVNRTTKQTQTTFPFLKSDNTQPTQYQLRFAKNSLQIKQFASGNGQSISSPSVDITLPIYYDRIFSSTKTPPTPQPPVQWKWVESLINKLSAPK